MRHRGRWVLVSLGVAALLTAGCTSSQGGGGGGGGGSVKQGGTLRIGSDVGIDSLNPFVGIEQDAFNAWENVYPQLVQYDLKTLAFVPDFATSWRQSPDGLTWTFTTRQAKWSDGQPLTAEDVAWTVNTILKYKNGATAGGAAALAHVQSAVAENPTTFVLTYSKPVANVLSNLQQVSILPQQVWGKYATGNGSGLKTFPNTPTPSQPFVAGGPFTVSKWTKDQITLFQANPNWYGPKPNIDGFGLQQFSNDDAMVEALKNGELDAVEGLPVTSVAAVKATNQFHIYTGPSLFFRDFIINPNPQKTNNRELLNPLVREAFEYAMDRQEIVKTAWLGYASPGTTMVPPVTGAWHDSSIKAVPFDITKANQLLDQAGYPMGSNGLRVADGHPMSYNVIFPTDQRGPGDRTIAILQADFRQIGVQLKQKSMDPTAAFAAITSNHYRNFDLAYWYWVPLMDPDFILSAYTCAQYGNWNDNGYCNATYDKLYAQQGVTIDPAKRRQIVYQMQQMIYDSRAEPVLVYNDIVDTWRLTWTGFVESPNGLWTQLSKVPLESVHQV